MKVLITPYPFAEFSESVLREMEANGIKYTLNPFNRKIKPEELEDLISEYDALIAGTEKLTDTFYQKAKNLKLIVRLGIGLDNVNLDLCRQNHIKVAFTPTAPSYAVAEFTFAAILESLKKISIADKKIRQGQWEKQFGNLLRHKTLGILGFGKVGKILASFLQPFNVKILASDLYPDSVYEFTHNVAFTSVEDVLKNSDIISVNLPLTPETKGLINYDALSLCKKNPILINTARGLVISETCLERALQERLVSHAFLDTFINEPYTGSLVANPHTTLTAHMASSCVETRVSMEEEAIKNLVFFNNSLKMPNEVV